MRKITAGLFMSLDGVVEAPETWHFPYMDEELGAAVGAQQASADTLLLGRRTYEEFAAVWPGRSGPMADGINGIRKLVVSGTLERADWANSTLVRPDATAELTRLKAGPGGGIAVTGSITLTRALLRAGLLDELNLFVHPVVLGAGRRLFDADGDRLPLALAGSTAFGSGVVHLTYRPA
ncbi:dihydrofolate reductase family protein [Streptomyces avicenniae]|uniref:dihydrofolate reductase family protein n=1 Tax=Streptomyces avicenniae TaxID=500153 RepID=UPI00069C9240|nr:dihydrofolate reductase family protein [Streptomyces avicenniae]